MRRFRLAATLTLLVLASSWVWGTQAQQGAQFALWPAEAFRLQWQRTDALVAQGGAGYSWYWGPAPRSQPMLERDEESPGGRRLVQYYDKGRMELPVRLASGLAARQLSFGRLTYEMVSGNLQLGARRFDTGKPAQIPVAGDADDPLAPTYAAFARLLAPAPVAIGQRPALSLDRSGTTLARADLASAYADTAYTLYDDVLGHNIPGVFAQFMARRGAVNTPQGRATEQIIDPLSVIGRPLTEAYWADVQMNGRIQPVLVQPFERRVLTYNPANSAAFRVEMGNVGLHYYEWRYGANARSNRSEVLLDHFETDGGQALNGNYWFSFDDQPDGGSSTASNGTVSPGAIDSVRAMRLNFNVTETIPFSYAALAVNLDRAGTPLDMRNYAAVGFWARGNNGRFSLQISSGISDEPFKATFTAPGEWTWIELPLGSLRQDSGPGVVDRGQGFANATRLQFRPADKPSVGTLDVDDIVLITGATLPTVEVGLPLVDNFEDGNLTTPLNTEWFTYDDRDAGGNSVAELAVVSPSTNGSRSALRFRGSFDNMWGGEPFLGMGVPLAGDNQVIDITDYKAVLLSIKPDARHYRLQINSKLIKDGNQYGLTLVAPEGQWNSLYVPIQLLTLLDTTKPQPIDLRLALTQVESIIITPLEKPEAFQLLVDDLSLAR